MEKIHTFVVLAYKESKLLEECIKSVIRQDTNVVIATSTPNDFISSLAEKYNLEVIINNNHKGIGYDFDFAINCVDSKLVTIAHQDDIYESNYAFNVIKEYNKHKDALIINTDYYEIRNNKKVLTNKLLKIKRVLIFPLRFKSISGIKFIKRWVLRFGNSICCPSVTFVKDNLEKEIYGCNLMCDVDWQAWEKLSRKYGKFIYINKKLMGHRIHTESTTSDIIENNIRTKEDFEIFKLFWPSFIAKRLCKKYKKSEESNKVGE